MKQLNFTNNEYITPPETSSFWAGLTPSLVFYCRFLWIVYCAGMKAKKRVYDDAQWYGSSYDVLHVLEQVGIRFQVTGFEHFQKIEGPFVVIGNHMSMMETVVLPIFLSYSKKRLTFVIKESLLKYPVFKHVMSSREPIAVTRSNPRQDLKLVMEQGVERLDRGISVVVFPQATRALVFDPSKMSSIGVKLAKRAGVPIVPMALQTSAWGNGKLFKDLGRIDVKKDVHFAFGEPITVKGKGAEEQQQIIDFIQSKLQEWQETPLLNH